MLVGTCRSRMKKKWIKNQSNTGIKKKLPYHSRDVEEWSEIFRESIMQLTVRNEREWEMKCWLLGNPHERWDEMRWDEMKWNERAWKEGWAWKVHSNRIGLND